MEPNKDHGFQLTVQDRAPNRVNAGDVLANALINAVELGRDMVGFKSTSEIGADVRFLKDLSLINVPIEKDLILVNVDLGRNGYEVSKTLEKRRTHNLDLLSGRN